MSDEEKLHWLNHYLKNCLGEELEDMQPPYTFGKHKIQDTEVLSEPPVIIQGGREIRTLSIEMFLTTAKNIEVLTKESFALMCTNDPVLRPWYLWNIDRGRISI